MICFSLGDKEPVPQQHYACHVLDFMVKEVKKNLLQKVI